MVALYFILPIAIGTCPNVFVGNSVWNYGNETLRIPLAVEIMSE